jgi:shikimate kinase
MNNIVLIGMPGAGKSTVGVVLSKAQGMDFIDTDLLIQKAEGKLLQEIIDEKGIQEFLAIEEKIALNLKTSNSVIATGGSIVYSDKAMNHLKENSTVLYLKLPCRVIEERLSNMHSRGIAMGAGQSLLSLYDERCPLYERYADRIVDCQGRDVEAIITCIQNPTP